TRQPTCKNPAISDDGVDLRRCQLWGVKRLVIYQSSNRVCACSGYINVSAGGSREIWTASNPHTASNRERYYPTAVNLRTVKLTRDRSIFGKAARVGTGGDMVRSVVISRDPETW